MLNAKSFLFLILIILAFSNCSLNIGGFYQFYNSVTKILNKFYEMQGFNIKIKEKKTKLDFSKVYFMFQLYIHMFNFQLVRAFFAFAKNRCLPPPPA